MSTIQFEWEKYRNTIYPEGISAIQERELEQAFFSAALFVIGVTLEAATLPDKQGEIVLRNIYCEAMEYAQNKIENAKRRN